MSMVGKYNIFFIYLSVGLILVLSNRYFGRKADSELIPHLHVSIVILCKLSELACLVAAAEDICSDSSPDVVCEIILDLRIHKVFADRRTVKSEKG